MSQGLNVVLLSNLHEKEITMEPVAVAGWFLVACMKKIRVSFLFSLALYPRVNLLEHIGNISTEKSNRHIGWYTRYVYFIATKHVKSLIQPEKEKM